MRQVKRPDAVLIAGPTASGKSALAVTLARALGGQVINADSMQVYRDLSIITARPTPAEQGGIAHRLFGTIDGAENFSVSRWLAEAERERDCAVAAGAIPIFVGGTGLYFKALTQGLSDIPPVPDAIRADVRALAGERTPEALHALLAARDPQTAARLRPSDPQRILRALEVHAATGASLVDFQRSRRPPLLEPARCLAIFLTVERPVLRERIDQRFDRMMAEGALDEVARLGARGLDPALPVMRAHGVPPLLSHLAGRLSLDDAITAGKADTRRYIKRQETFARHQLPTFTFVPVAAAETLILESCP